MSLMISLPVDAETRLKERAQAAGQNVNQYIEQLLTKELIVTVQADSLGESPLEPPNQDAVSHKITDEEFESLVFAAYNSGGPNTQAT